MTEQDYRNIRDKQRGVNRKDLYGSNMAHYPFPHKLKSFKALTTFGTPGKLVRNNDENSTVNYDNMQNMLKLSELFSASI